MKQNSKQKIVVWIQNIFLSLLVSGVAIIGIRNVAVGLLFFGILCWMGKSRKKDAHVMSIIGRVFGTGIIFMLIILVISALCGVTSTILYAILKDILGLGQIKGIINVLVTVIVFIMIPFMENVFWNVISMQNSFINSVKKGFVIKGAQYKNLSMILLILFAVGYVVTILFHYVPANAWLGVVKTFIFTILGAIGLFLSEQAVR